MNTTARRFSRLAKSISTISIAGALFVGSMTTAHAAANTLPATNGSVSSTSAVEEVGTVEFLSTDDFENNTRNPAQVTASRDPIQYWYSVAYSTLDGNGRDWPVRVGINDGTGDFGRDHFASKHNLLNPQAVLAAFDTTPEAESGSHFEFITVVVRDGQAVFNIRVVGEQGATTTDGRYTAPDGRPIGVITAFCEGMTRCPDWVNS